MSIRCVRALLLAAFVSLACAGSARAQKPWLSVSGLTLQQLNDWMQGDASGYRLAYLNGYGTGEEVRFAAVAVRNSRRFEWHYLAGSLDQIREKDEEYRAKGCRPLCISGFLRDNGPRFAGVWVKDGVPVREKTAIHLTEKEYAERIKLEEANHYMPKMATGYADGAGSYRFTVLFVPAPAGFGWEEKHDLTEEQYQKAFDDCEKKGSRPSSISVYPTPAGLRYALILIKPRAKLDWYAKHDLSPQQFQSEFERANQEGYRLVSVAGYASGSPAAGPAPFHQAMRKFMTERGIKAGTLAVSRGGKLLLARGYGFADAEGRRRIQPSDPMRIAGLTRCVTAAAIYQLVRGDKLSLDDKVVPLLGLRPPAGQQPDPRWNDITVRHLLEHKGGWEWEKTFDPMFRPLEIAAALKGPAPAGPVDVIRYMMGQPLQFDPGSKANNSNFGYCILGRVIEKVSGQTYLGYVKKNIFAPLSAQSVELGRSLPEHRNPREPDYSDVRKGHNALDPESKKAVLLPDGWFYLEAMDASGGLIASSRDFLRFLDAYELSGEPRQGNGRPQVRFGKLPGAFTMAMQRPKGVNVAAFFNQSADPSGLDYFKIRDMMQEAADQQSGGLRYAAAWIKNR